MRNSLLFFALLMGVSLFFACNNAAPTEAEEAAEAVGEAGAEVTEAMATAASSAWSTGMDAYHEVMADVFHSAEEGNLTPLKENYKALAEAAETWAQASMPDKYEGKGVTEAMKELVKGSADIASVVENGTDEEMTKAITDLHDVFHKVVGMCNDTDEHKHSLGEGAAH